MDWNHPKFHSHVHVVNFVTSPTPFTEQRMDTPTWGLTKSDIILPTSWARFAMALKSSRNISRLQGESFVNNLSTTDEDARKDVKMNGIGARGLTEAFLMSKSSTRTLNLLVDYWKKAYNRKAISIDISIDISINRKSLRILMFLKGSFQYEYRC